MLAGMLWALPDRTHLVGGLRDKLKLLGREQAQGAAGWAVEDVTLLCGGLQAAVQPWAVRDYSV